VVDPVSCSTDLDTACDRVQAGVETTFRARVSDNIQLSNCQFVWRTSLGGSWQAMAAPSFSSIACEGDHIGACFEASTVHTFGSGGIYDVRAECWDSAFHTMTGNFVTITAEILSVTLSTGADANDPGTMSMTTASGSINTLFDLSSQVAGTATGNANFKFDCTNDGWDYERDNIDLSVSDPGWVKRPGDGNTETRVIAPNTFAVRDLCQYSPPNTYTANTLVERSISTATDTVDIEVSANTLPQAIPQTPIVDSYCEVRNAHITLPWQFSDLDPGDTQEAWQVQIATNQNFQQQFIVDDTGDDPPQTGANTEYSPASGVLEFNETTYHWRVKVWDEFDESPWATGTSFTTPVHTFPNPNFTFSPAFPSAEEQIGFTDQTTFASGSSGQGWSWDFGDTGTSSQQNPVHVYQENGAYAVTLIAEDDAGSCQTQKTVNVTLPFPAWQEISPF